MAFGEIPYHLQQFIAEQDYSLYTPIDHACWRFIMRVSQDFFKAHGHPKYLSGLKKTGITIEAIPKIQEMSRRLKPFGWQAVTITGFIPPEAFLEMQALRILPIACDMRKLEHISYTPAPDIVHEAAGHATLIVDESYASFLTKFGELAKKVIFAKEDTEVYEKILALSEIKEAPDSTEEQIQAAQKDLDEAYSKVHFVSEAQQLSRFGWWSTEYGLFKQGDQFLIYGAGLLSSVGESYFCLQDHVKKIPISLDCIHQDYDITKPQPQLFYTEDFGDLEKIIEELAQMMSYRRGGLYGLSKAREARTLVTIEFDSGLQVSGAVESFQSQNDVASQIVLSGPCQVSFRDQQIKGHGPSVYARGLTLQIDKTQAETSTVKQDPTQTFLVEGNNTRLIVQAERVTSVFGGAADRARYLKEVNPKINKPRPQKSNRTEQKSQLFPLYQDLRKIRESEIRSLRSLERIEAIAKTLESEHRNDWLLRMEILEILKHHQRTDHPLYSKLASDLKVLAGHSENLKMLIARGFTAMENLPLVQHYDGELDAF